MPLKRKSAGTKNGWIQVTDIDGETHWVYSAAVSEELTCVVVKMNYVALRQSPDEAAPLTPLKYADKYWPFKKVVRDDDGWYQVEDDFGGRHWIRQSHAWQPTVYSQISF